MTDFVGSSMQSANNEIKSECSSSLGKYMYVIIFDVSGAMQSIGIKNTRVAVGIATVGAATATGMVLARKKSMAHRVMYPLLFGGLAWGTFYCSLQQNRTYIRSQMQSIQSGYTKSINKIK